MADKSMTSTKKCPVCQQWSRWQQQAHDRCEHCGELLDPRTHAEAQQAAIFGHHFHQLNATARRGRGGLVWLFKTMVRGGQLLFIAVIGFIVWLVTAIAS
jgi:hypothetical protein